MDTGQKFLTKAEFDNFLRRLSSKNIQFTIPATQVTQNIITNIEAGWPSLKDRIVRYMLPDMFYDNASLTAIGCTLESSGFTSGRLLDADGAWKWMQTQAVANNFAYWRIGTNATPMLVLLPHNPIFFAKIKTGASIAAMRLWIGLTSNDITNVDDPLVEVCAFRYSAGISGNWYAVTDDGATLTPVDTGLAIAANTIYTPMIEVVNGNTVKFYINGALLHTATTNLPSAATDFGWNIYWATTENVAKRIYISRVFLESN